MSSGSRVHAADTCVFPSVGKGDLIVDVSRALSGQGSGYSAHASEEFWYRICCLEAGAGVCPSTVALDKASARPTTRDGTSREM